MFFDTKQKILFVAAVVILLFAVASTVARINRKPDLKALPADMQKAVPLQAPLLIEDDAGVTAE